MRKRELFALKKWVAAVCVLCLCPMVPLVGLQSVITAGNHVTSKQQQWRIPLKNPVDSGKRVFDISVNTGQTCMGVEADTPEK